ncbi:transposase [Spirillospora sp. NPDC000708]
MCRPTSIRVAIEDGAKHWQPPVARRSGRPSKWTKQRLIDRIRWRARTGSPWRDVPACCGSWQAVHGLFSSLAARWRLGADPCRAADPR